MKKIQIALICVLSIFVIAFAGNATAYNASFTHTCYYSETVSPTIDGLFSSGDWAASASVPFGTNGVIRTMWTLAPVVYACFFIETWDTTNDAGDYWEICFDSTTAGADTPPNGGAAPQADDFKLVITGHDSPTVQWYKGTGTAWTPITPSGFSDIAVFQQAQSLSASPSYATPHYMWEMHIDKTNTAGLGITAMGYNWAQYVAYYDAHAGGYGLQSWPPSPALDTNPNSWGYVPYEFAAAPEGFSIGILVVLSSTAVIASAVLIRKRSEITKLAAI